MKITDILDRLDSVSAMAVVIVIMIVFFILGWFISRRKDISDLWNSWYQNRKKKDELLNMVIENNAKLEKYDQCIESLIVATKEILADRINEKYKKYISIGGIPEDEVDEFTSLHFAYKGCNGNHTGDAKFNYVMEHLPIIPVEVNLVFDDNER